MKPDNYNFITTTYDGRFIAAFDELKELRRFLKSETRTLLAFQISLSTGDYTSFDPTDRPLEKS